MLLHPALYEENGYAYPGALADQLSSADSTHVSGRSCVKCDPARRVDRRPHGLDTDSVVHYGIIATGSAVIKHGPTREGIEQKHAAICLEMEVVGLMNHFPCWFNPAAAKAKQQDGQSTETY
jgi:hypothetical protein